MSAFENETKNKKTSLKAQPIYLPKPLYKVIKKESEKQDRSVNKIIVKILEDWADEQE